MKDRLAIFDLDGTLYDTSVVNFKAYQLALQEYHTELDQEFFFSHCNGQYYRQFLPIIDPKLSESDMERIHNRKKELYNKCLPNAIANENLIDMIRLIRQAYHIVLVTTASRRNAEEILRYFEHISLFDLLITQEDVVKKKPDPEGFQKAMDHFKVCPAHTIVFEDSAPGIHAALACGVSVCKVLDFVPCKTSPEN